MPTLTISPTLKRVFFQPHEQYKNYIYIYIYINLDAVRWGLGHVLDEASEQGVFLGCCTRPGEDPQSLGLGMEFRERKTVSEDGRRKKEERASASY